MNLDLNGHDSIRISGAKQFYRDQQAQHAYVGAYVDFLDRINWDFFATFTTGYEMTLNSARRMMEGYHEAMCKYFKGTKMFWVAEPFEIKEGYHTHALVKVPVEKPTELQYKNGVGLRSGQVSTRHDDIVAFNENVRFHYMIDQWQKVSGGSKAGKWNRIDLQTYNPRRKAGGYVGKYITKTKSDYDFLSNGS